MANPLKKLVNYIKASRDEMKKVTWPSKREARNHTLLVIAISLGMAAFLGLIDFFLSKIIEQLV